MVKANLDPPPDCSAGPKGDTLYHWISTFIVPPDRRQERETGCVVADGGPALWPDGHGSVKGCLAQAWRRSWFSDKWTDDFSSAFGGEMKRRQSSKILILVNGGSAICLWILWQLKLTLPPQYQTATNMSTSKSAGERLQEQTAAPTLSRFLTWHAKKTTCKRL
ncbi:hypothetical protein OIU78_012926 [Salix suchowensis]|nr:hypothetical protein OIU78_012926 [Salix suchowensis]